MSALARSSAQLRLGKDPGNAQCYTQPHRKPEFASVLACFTPVRVPWRPLMLAAPTSLTRHCRLLTPDTHSLRILFSASRHSLRGF